MSYFWTNVSLDRNDLLVIGYQDGKRFKSRVPVKPHLYVDDHTGQSDIKSIDGKSVRRLDFENLRSIMSFRDKHDGIENFNQYGLQTARSWHYIYYDYLYTNYPSTVDYDPKEIKVAVIDIEVAADEGFPDIETAPKPITAIAIAYGSSVVVWGCGEFTPQEDNHFYIKCENEHDLLDRFVDTWSKMQIDVVTGWNTESFDIPYLINRCNNIIGKSKTKNLSPWKMLDQNSRIEAMTGHKGWDIIGINSIDYLAAYKKFTYSQQESYSLDNIAHVELGESKLDYSEYDGLMGLYKNNFQKFIEYNIKDVLLVKRLDDKMKLLELMYAIAYDAKVNLNDAFTSVRLWDVIIHNYLMDKNIVVPRVGKHVKERPNVGGYVKDPQRGMQDWIVSFDLNSLYPHLIMQYNISPETYKGISKHRTSVDEILNGAYSDIDHDEFTIGGSGAMYSKDFRGFLPTLMDRIYQDRVKFNDRKKAAQKKLRTLDKDDPNYNKVLNETTAMHNMQMAKKIQLNSAYGALANPYFRWFKMEHAEAITVSGQLSIRWIEKKFNEYLNDMFGTDEDYVIAIDTDSAYVTFKRIIDPEKSTEENVEFLNEFVEKTIDPLFEKWYQELADYTNAYAQKMVMKREVIADKGIWVAKKHYALNVWDLEGNRFTDQSQLKIMGIESVRSSTPKVCRVAINSALRIMLNENEARLIEFIANFRKEFFDLPFEDIAFPRGVSDITKWCDKYQNTLQVKKGCPIHVRGSITYNNLINDKNLVNQYDYVRNGDKIKFSYLKLPNPAREHVIACPKTLPKQFGLDKYVDYDKQFQKSFLEPIESIAHSAGLKTEIIATLEDFWK
jgi:DNA polymerase elongation subunit (family B)